MSEKFYLNVLKGGIYSSLLVVFFVFKDLLFPFITSKQIPFNILLEILFVFWLVFIVKFPNYRPKKSYISFGLISFFAITTISCFTGVDLNLSFWGDVERMLGVFHLLHFLVFYFIVITVMKTWKDWKVFFIISLIFSVLVSFYGFGHIAYSTIGNTAYVGGYIIFNIYFALILFFKEKSDWKWAYLLTIPILLLQFNKANITGAYVGLGFSVIVLFFLYAILSKNKKIRNYTWGLFAFLVVLTFFLLANKDSEFFKNHKSLRFVSEINLQKNTFQTRLISWRAGIRDLKEHPLLGTGHGNYAIIFDKYFEANFYDYTRTETYFDRAHNNLIDIASTTGLLGFFTYLSIFAALGYYMISGYRAGKMDINEFVLVSSLVVAYFVQNLAVFDSLVTYMGIMMTFGFVYWMINRQESDIKDSEINGLDYAVIGVLFLAATLFFQDKTDLFKVGKADFLWFASALLVAYVVFEFMKEKRRVKITGAEINTFAFVAIVVGVILYQYNILPLKMLRGTIAGQAAWAQGMTEETYDIYRDTLELDTVLDRDSRTSFIRLIASAGGRLDKLGAAKKEEIINYTVDLARKNVAYNPGDSMNQMVLAQVLDLAARNSMNNEEKFSFYVEEAIQAIDKSIEASPKRVPIYYQKAQIYSVTLNQPDKAIEVLKYALSLNEKYYDSHCYMGRTMLYFKQDEGYEYIGSCIDLGGAKLLAPADLVSDFIDYFGQKGESGRVFDLRVRLSELDPKDIDNWIILIKEYKEKGERDKLIKAVDAAVKADPSIKSYAEEFLNESE